MICKNCNHENPDDSLFCNKCGQKIPIIVEEYIENNVDITELKNQEEKDLLNNNTRKNNKKIIVGLSFITIIVIFVVLFQLLNPVFQYNSATKAIDEGNYDYAISTFEKLSNFKDSAAKIIECKYKKANNYINSKKYNDALEILLTINSYHDVEEIIIETKYSIAMNDFNNKNYQTAIKIFKELDNYKDSKNMFLKSNYNYAVQQYDLGNFEQAISIFNDNKNYEKTQKYISQINLMNKFQGVWKGEPYGFQEITIKGWKLYRTFFPESLDQDTFEYDIKLKNSVITWLSNEQASLSKNGENLIVEDFTFSKANIHKDPETPKLGMTKDEVLKSYWGSPEKINRTTNAYGVSEQWVYSKNRYLYFENGILTTIQD